MDQRFQNAPGSLADPSGTPGGRPHRASEGAGPPTGRPRPATGPEQALRTTAVRHFRVDGGPPPPRHRCERRTGRSAPGRPLIHRPKDLSCVPGSRASPMP